MSLFGIIDFGVAPHSKSEIKTLHKHNITVKNMGCDESIKKLTEDLLYDREWCKEQGIDYCNIKSEDSKMAENFVINSIFNSTYIQDGHCKT